MQDYGYHNQRQVQANAGKKQQISKTDRKQILVNDLVGRLYADVERAVNLLGGDVAPRYSDFTLNSSLGLRETLLNIELTTTGIVGMVGEEVKSGFWSTATTRALIPTPDAGLVAHLKDMWENLARLPQRKETKAHMAIIRLVLDGLSKGELFNIPDELTNGVVSAKDRDDIAKDFVKNNQTEMLRINHMAHTQSSHTEEVLSQMEKPHYPPQMPTKPLSTKIKQHDYYRDMR